MSRFINCSYLSTLCLLFLLSEVNAQHISTSKKNYIYNEIVEVQYENLSGKKGEWIAISKKGSSPEKYEYWNWTKGRKSGNITFDLVAPGNYEVRVFENWPKSGFDYKLSDTFSVVNKIARNDEIKLDEESVDQSAEITMMMSSEWILNRMEHENSSVGLARLEAILKRKILEVFHMNSLHENLTLSKITKKEIELIAEEYKKLEAFGLRWLVLRETFNGIKYLFDDTHPDFVNNRIRKIFPSHDLSQFFKSVYTRDQLLNTYLKISKAGEIKDFWRIQLGRDSNLKKMNCQNFNIYCFKSGLSSKDLNKINELKNQEIELFKSVGKKPPLFPPMQSEINESCMEVK